MHGVFMIYSFMQSVMQSVIAVLPEGVRQRLWVWQQQGPFRWPPVGHVRPESLWRVRPISRVYGMDRGQPLDRYYIEQFIAAHQGAIRGRVLEIADNSYTRRFGGTRVTQSDVLHIEEGHPHVTIVADLSKGENLPSNTFDCVICTQTLPFIFDLQAVVKTLQRIMKPGGTLLVTVPGITKISRYDVERWGHYWSFTRLSIARLFGDVFGEANVQVASSGNVLAATAFLQGLARQELTTQELAYYDPDYELIITARVEKPLTSVT